MKLIIAGIHTGIGKTFCSAILVEALGYDYWKPVQAGDLECSDSSFVRANISRPDVKVHAEAYRLQLAASPHWAAAKQGIRIGLDDLVVPPATKGLVIETAGGVMSPLSDRLLNLDLMHHLGYPVLLVCQDYLGSINHTLMSIRVMQTSGIPLCGLLFSGVEVPSTRELIAGYSGLPILLSVPLLDRSKESITRYAASISSALKLKIHDACAKR